MTSLRPGSPCGHFAPTLAVFGGALFVMLVLLFAEGVASAAPRGESVRGVWVWDTHALLRDSAPLLDACQGIGVNEVYLAVTHTLLHDRRLAGLLKRLRAAGLRVEALIGDPTWARPQGRPAMLALIDAIIAFDVGSAARFEAIHLDVEPHTLPQYRSVDLSVYLPETIESFRRARARAATAGLSLSADIPRMFLWGDALNRDALARAVPRLFLMLYEVTSSEVNFDEARRRIQETSEQSLRAAYSGLYATEAGSLVVGLSVDDHGERLGAMLNAVEDASGSSARYAGWAIHDFSRYVALQKRPLATR